MNCINHLHEDIPLPSIRPRATRPAFLGASLCACLSLAAAASGCSDDNEPATGAMSARLSGTVTLQENATPPAEGMRAVLVWNYIPNEGYDPGSVDNPPPVTFGEATEVVGELPSRFVLELDGPPAREALKPARSRTHPAEGWSSLWVVRDDAPSDPLAWQVEDLVGCTFDPWLEFYDGPMPPDRGGHDPGYHLFGSTAESEAAFDAYWQCWEDLQKRQPLCVEECDAQHTDVDAYVACVDECVGSCDRPTIAQHQELPLDSEIEIVAGRCTVPPQEYFGYGSASDPE